METLQGGGYTTVGGTSWLRPDENRPALATLILNGDPTGDPVDEDAPFRDTKKVVVL